MSQRSKSAPPFNKKAQPPRPPTAKRAVARPSPAVQKSSGVQLWPQRVTALQRTTPIVSVPSATRISRPTVKAVVSPQPVKRNYPQSVAPAVSRFVPTSRSTSTPHKALQIASAVLNHQETAGWASRAAKRGKDGKKKKESWGSWLLGAAKTAASIAPAILPLLMAGHAPTNLAAVQAGKRVTSLSDPSAAMVGIAQAASVAKVATGTYPPTYSSSGNRITSVMWPGCEEVLAVSLPASNMFTTGQVIARIDLDPSSPDWVGTQLITQASLWQRYRLRRLSVMYQPAVDVQLSGQLVMFCDADPDNPWTFTGDASVRAAREHQFADIFQPWCIGCAGIATDKRTDDLYVNPDGSDARRTSPGFVYLVCAAEINTTGLTTDSLGSIIIAYEYEFSIAASNAVTFSGGSGIYMTNPVTLSIAVATSENMIGWFNLDTTNQPAFISPTVTGPLQKAIPYGLFTAAETGTTYAGFKLPVGTFWIDAFHNMSCVGTPTTQLFLVSQLGFGPTYGALANHGNGWDEYDIANLLVSAAYNTAMGVTEFTIKSTSGGVKVRCGFMLVVTTPQFFSLVPQYGSFTSTFAINATNAVMNIFSVNGDNWVVTQSSLEQVVQQKLDALTLESDSLQSRYDELVARLDAAQIPAAPKKRLEPKQKQPQSFSDCLPRPVDFTRFDSTTYQVVPDDDDLPPLESSDPDSTPPAEPLSSPLIVKLVRLRTTLQDARDATRSAESTLAAYVAAFPPVETPSGGPTDLVSNDPICAFRRRLQSILGDTRRREDDARRILDGFVHKHSL